MYIEISEYVQLFSTVTVQVLSIEQNASKESFKSKAKNAKRQGGEVKEMC